MEEKVYCSGYYWAVHLDFDFGFDNYGLVYTWHFWHLYYDRQQNIMTDNKTDSDFTISPSLFIGLGTNGWQILDDLRKLMFEEFGRAGLPCCRYLALETDAGKKPDNSLLPNEPAPYEKIDPRYITLPSVDIVKKRIQSKSGEHGYVDGLSEWLDPRLINNQGTKSFTAGAGHIRQAGRLCLWENWDSVAEGLEKSIQAIKDPIHHSEADAFLRDDYFPSKHSDAQVPSQSFINDAPKVYICGTFCGGTCSGTFIDVAYFVNELLGIRNRSAMRGGNQSKVIGLFTFIDNKSLKPNKKVHLINSWAALRELDFYCQGSSSYQAKLPDGRDIETSDEPFDTVYLESMANSDTTFNNENGLTQMCAMNLFTEVVTGMADDKDTIRVNFTSVDGYMDPNVSGYLRAFSAFGLSAIWYPRYRISRAINRTLAIDMIAAWRGHEATVNQNTLDEDVQRDWNKIYNRAKNSLIGAVEGARCPQNLPGEIDALFRKEQAGFAYIEWEGIESYLSTFPKKAPLSDRLQHPQGDYYRKISNAGTLATKDLRTSLEKSLIKYLANHTVAEAKAYVQRLIEKSQQAQAELPENLPDSPKLVDFNPEQGVPGNPFGQWLRRERPKSLSQWPVYLLNLAAWFLLNKRRPQAEEPYRRVIWREARQRAKDHLNKIRNSTLHRVLENSLQFMEDLDRRVDAVDARLKTFQDTCEKERDRLIAPQTASNVLIISQDDPDSLEDDVNQGVAEIRKNRDAKSWRREFIGKDDDPIALMENERIDNLILRVDKAFNRDSQSVTNQFQIGKEAVSNFKKHIRRLVKSSLPYVETVGEWKPLPMPKLPNRLFCHDSDAGKQLTAAANEELQNTDDYKEAIVNLGHFVFLYREIAGLTITDLAIHKHAAKELDISEKNPRAFYTNFTHQGGENFFNLQRDEDFKHLRRWIDAMRYLSPDSFKERGESLMLQYKNEQGMRVEIAVERKRALTKELRKFLEKHEAQTLIDQFQETLRALGKPAVIRRMEAEVEKLPENDSKARSEMQGRHEKILAETFLADSLDRKTPATDR
ncbi:MAG: hypothetical protein M2R45_04056 [Verrucomicrobia subdivision 3 bacterium]|nr:hypothetical protein [Limisphaerales bacterium]MCS1416995.1 hypothetical protein [Limisphaerales bacterium]